MKRFKEIDAWVSTGLIIGFALAAFKYGGFALLYGYFIVGSWQVISMLVHVYYRSFTQKKGNRYVYHWVTFVSVITMPAGSFFILAFTAPFMAIYYTWLCFDEVRKMNERPLSVLK